MGDMVVKDNFNGFSENCTEMGNSFGLFAKQSDEETQIVSHISPSKDTISSECKKFNVIDIDKKKACTAPRTQCIAQKCDFVHNCGTDESKAKLKEMQSNWIELHKCIRIIYKNAISSVPCIVANEEIPKRVSDSVKVLIEKLCEEDCQQLFIRVEVLVRDFVLEAKDRLKDLQNNVEDIPVLYLRGLLASYGAFCVAADNLAPFIPQLDALLMKRFSVNFQLLNKYLFQTCLYADSFVQNNVPLYISQLRTSNSGTHFTNQELVHSYLAFDDEMTDIASRWLDVKKMILKLSKKRVISNCKQPLLLEDWKMYREHRELAASRTWQLRSQKRETSEFDVQLLSLLDDITNHMCELEISSNKKQVFNTCRSCNSDISCSCDDCTIKHIFSCVETPPTSPDHNSSDNTHTFNSAELLEQFKAMSKVNKIQMPKNFFKLITDKVLSKSFVQNNDGETVIEEVKPEIQTPKIPVTPPEAIVTSSNTAAPPATSKVPVSTNVANSITNSTHVHNSQTTNTSIVPSSDKSGRILKEVTKSTQNKMAHCNHQYQVVKKAKEQQTCKEGCAEHGPVKNQKESKRCDCPHCEVFENSNAQTTTKNNKTRDRLRIRLNEKRNKALKEKGATTKNVEPPKHKDQENIKVTTKSGLDTPTCVTGGEVEDTRDIKELIDFIEGTDRNAKFLNAQKRLAKKARRRERKLEEERLKEQERLRIEAEILLQEQRRLEEIKRQEEARLREQQQAARNKKKNKKSKDKQNKGNHNNNNNNNINNSNNNNNSNTKSVKTIPVEVSQYIPPALNEKLKIHSNGGSGGPMVTIKRVMEHSSSEPTVTITLKGSTPDKDKLLYTLVNGHTNLVKSVEDVTTKTEPLITMTKSQKKKAKKEQKQLLLQQQQLQQQQQQQKQQQLQNIENNKTLSKKERKKLRNELNMMQNQKNQQNTNNINKIDSTNEIKKKIVTTTTQSNIITSTSTNTNSININNNNNNNTIKNDSPLNLQMLRLPPGITITKVDGPAVNRKIRINSKNESQTPTPPPIAAPVQSTDNRSGVIVVDTVKLKQVLPVAEQPQHPQTAVSTTTTTTSSTTTTTTTSKKKKKKNKNKSDNTNTNTNQNQNQQQQNIQLAYKMPTDANTTMKGSNTNGNSIVTIKNPMFYQLQESLNGKMNKQKLIENVTTTSTTTTTIKDARPQQASIIKGANGMVTIRSPRLNGNIPNGHSEIPVGIPDLKPVLGPNTSVYKPAKTETNNKPFNAQEILSGLPGIEITKINKNSTKSKNDCKVFQPADVSIIPTNLGNGTNGDVYKLFSDNTDWTLESVFAPKDLKEDEELDADELELEAFKRFCQQSVPPERKEKVAHLNVKDIVLKKKNSNNICS